MGLVEYDSDSDNEVPSPPVAEAPKTAASIDQTAQPLSPTRTPPKPAVREPTPPVPPGAAPDPSSASPVVGPSRPPVDLPSPQPLESGIGEDAPLSPYTRMRNEIHSLTLPQSIPDIPPSPPGSPKPSLAQKFANFRNLKAQGVHFNEKLVLSSALRNPNLLEKLTAFVGFTSTDQYSSNLPTGLWNPDEFPKEAFSEELAKSQVEIGNERREREAKEGRKRVGFVGSAAAPAQAVAATAKGDGRMSVTERIMKGLDTEQKSATPPVGRDDTRRRDGRREERDGRERYDGRRDERRDDGRDRKRRRSRSWSRDRDRDRDRRVRDYEYRDRR